MTIGRKNFFDITPEPEESESVNSEKPSPITRGYAVMLSSTKCLVTGASSGIGKATCKILTGYGASVVGTGRNAEALELLRKEGHIIDYIVADLASDNRSCSTSASNSSNPSSTTTISICAQVIHSAVQKLGGQLTALVNNAGVLRPIGMGDDSVSDEVMMENYHYHMKTNTEVPFELMVHAIPYLRQVAEISSLSIEEAGIHIIGSEPKKRMYPSIVNVSSVNGKHAFAGCVAYCMSKSALDQLTRCASVDLAKYGIRVNAVNPGVIETNLQKTGGLNDEKYDAFLKRSIDVTHPLAQSLGRVGTPEEVGEFIAFLLSDRACFMTGECIAIDGGRQNLGAR